ncbi:MAG: ABC transporter substrate-binding protein [Desulfobacterales bacterium]|jgi:peptide/nickel transport system substrate-binding protein
MSGKKKNMSAVMSRRQFIVGGGTMMASLMALPVLPRFAMAASGNVLRIRDYGDITCLDPGIASNAYDETVNGAVHNKLIAYKPGREWAWQLEIAQSVKQLDPTHIAFELKPGVQFSNDFGEMTAEDVKFSFERIVDPALSSPLKGDWVALKEVQVKDKYQGIIVLNKPFQPLWMTTLPYMSGNIVSKKAFSVGEGKHCAQPPCFSGPYIIKDRKPKQVTILARNPDWKGERPDFDEVHIFPIDDEKTAEMGFEAGDLDYTRVSIASYNQLKDKPPENSVVEKYPSLYYVWVGMNMEHPKLKDERVREAVQYAIDVPAVLESGYDGVAEPSTGIIPPGLVGHRPKNILPREARIDKARELLAEAGYPNGIDLNIEVRNKAAFVTSAQVIQAVVAQAGIRLEVNLHDSGSFWSLGDESKGDRWKDLQLVHNRFSSAPDPYWATQWFTKEQVGIWNWERFKNDEFNELHNKAMSEGDLKKRDAMYRRMQDIMEESGAYLFLTHEAVPVIFRKSIKPAFRPDGLPLVRYFKKA